MSVRPLVRRALTVSTAAAGLSVLSCGIAVAGPLPPVPDPGDAVATVQQTVSGAVDTVTSALPVTVPPTAPGGTTPEAPAAKTPTTTKHAPTVVHHPSAGKAARPASAAHPTGHPATLPPAAPLASYDYAALRYPTSTAISATSQAPAIAPIPAAPTAPITTTLAASSDHQQPSSPRALLLALAVAAAAALSIEHMRQAQQRLAH
jgi:hypothetical protein